jgi:signal transduction histidine kinase
VTDITAALHQHAPSAVAQHLYREIWDSIPGSAVALSATGRIVDANRAWYETAAARGAPPDAFVGASYLDATRRAAQSGDAVASRALEGISRVLRRRNEQFTMEYEGRVPGSSESQWFRMTAFPLRSANRGAIVMHWDITERRISELSIQQARDDLAEMQQASGMSELATSIAHELNQPLATIMAAASTARRQLRSQIPLPGGPDLGPIVDDIMMATARAAQVMRRARTMVRRDRREMEPLALREIVTTVSRLLASDLILNQVALTVRLRDVPPVIGDRMQLQQVVLNLLSNAVDAVRSEPGDRRRVTISITRPVLTLVELLVADTGRGIDGAIADRVFEPFTTTKRHRTGLGLTIVRAIVEAHGGRVAAESSSEGGAAFRVSLPCSA